MGRSMHVAEKIDAKTYIAVANYIEHQIDWKLVGKIDKITRKQVDGLHHKFNDVIDAISLEIRNARRDCKDNRKKSG